MITTSLWAFAITIGVLVVFHELGHYWAARLCGVKVLRFSVGFGKVLFTWHFRKGETEWALSAIPLGGYVKMLDEREGEVASHELSRAFNRKPVWQRMVIVVAGPVFNLLLAVILYFGLFFHGVPGTRPVLGEVPMQTPAAEAQLQAKETILSVNGVSIQSWEEARWELLIVALRHGQIAITGRTADGVEHGHMLDTSQIEASDLEHDHFMQKLGMQVFIPAFPAIIDDVIAGDPAERAGLRAGDTVLRAEGQEIAHWDGWVDVVRSHPQVVLHLDIERDGHQIAIEVTPKRDTEGGKVIGRVGAAGPRIDPKALDEVMMEVSYSPFAALEQGARRTWEVGVLSLEMMGRMALGQVSVKSMSGPAKLASYAGKSVSMGLLPFIFFLAAVSVGVGVLNILPIPVLDGGHLLYYIAEFFMGRPVPDNVLEMGQKIGVVLLSTLMILVLYNDISSLISG